MEVKKGYKMTEVGMIPQDWEIYTFADLANLSKIKISPRRESKNYQCIELEHIEQGSGQLLGSVDSKNQLSDKWLFSQGDVLFGKLRPYLRKFHLANFTGVCTTEIWVFKSTNNTISPYLYLIVQSDKFIEAANLSTGTKMPRAEWKTVSQIPTPLPPTLTEQRAIATALSDTDALIAALDRLIAKKKAIKQGAMQELLTGRRRLEGFEGEWRFFKLGSNSILKARIGWQGLTTAEYLDHGDYILITGTDFLDGSIYWSGCNYVDQKRYVQDVNIQVKPGDVLVTKDGTIGKVAYVSILPKPATLNSGVFVIRPTNDAYLPRFFYYILASPYFEDFLRKLSAGSTISHLYQKDFVHFEFPLPPTIEEQRAIAQILTDMDAEIVALEQQRDKYKAVKQGMMQELLTGKTRLV